MALDYSKLSDDELEAIANDDYSRLSDSTLTALAESDRPKAKEERPTELIPVPPSPFVNRPTMPSMPGGQALQTAKTIAAPAAKAVGSTLGSYITNPVSALTDITMAHFGLPPPVAGTKIAPGVQESYQQVKDWLSKQGQFAPKTVPGEELANANKINQAIGPQGLADAMKPGATMPTQVPPAVGGPAAQQGSTFIERMGQKFGSMAAKVAPVLKAAPIIGAGLEGVNTLKQAGENDYIGAGLSAAQAATFLGGVPGAVASIPLALIQHDYQKWKQMTPEQKKQAAMESLSGTAPGQAW